MTRTVAAFVATALLGCGRADHAAGATEQTPRRGGTLRIVSASDDLVTWQVGNSYFLAPLFWRALVEFAPVPDADRQMDMAPDLARELPTLENGGLSADGRTWTFHFRRGVFWNTTPPREVVASDVARGIKLGCNAVAPAWGTLYLKIISGYTAFCTRFQSVRDSAAIHDFAETESISGVRPIDDSTLVIQTDAPALDFLPIIRNAIALPVEALDQPLDHPDLAKRTIANGPYQPVRYTAHREIVFVRNPAWQAASDPIRAAWVDSISVTMGASAESALERVETGVADVMFGESITPRMLALINEGHPHVYFFPSPSRDNIGWNLRVNMADAHLRRPTDDLRVRQALGFAVNRAAVVRVAGGTAVSSAMQQIAMKGDAAFIPGFAPFSTPLDTGDVEKARGLLRAAGYPDGIFLRFRYPKVDWVERGALTVQAALARAGIRTTLIPVEQSQWFSAYMDSENARRGDWDISLAGWQPDWLGNNGRSILWLLYDGRLFGPGSWNVGGYQNVEVERLFDRAMAARTDVESSVLWQQAARRIVDDGAVIPLVAVRSVSYRSARVRNCYAYAPYGGACDLGNLWLERER
jgi:ABC-type transport system substrate-binding protein